MNQKKNLLTAALAVLTAFSSVSAQGGEDGGSTYEKFRVGGYGEWWLISRITASTGIGAAK